MNKAIIALLLIVIIPNSYSVEESFCPQGSTPNPAVLFCDSFETQGDDLEDIDSSRYYEFNNDEGDLIRTTNESAHGEYSARVLWQEGEVSAGSFHVNFGRSPLTSNIQPNTDFREIYWRMYVKMPLDFEGYPDKLSRVTVVANSSWAQAMIGHVWTNESRRTHLQVDPVSGIKNNQLVTTKWNDFSNFTWLGAVDSSSQTVFGEWTCVEAQVKLNDASTSNGEFKLYTDGQLTASKSNIDWVGSWDDYGLNAILFSNYWNGAGSPKEQSRFIDAVVISTERVGCIDTIRPKPPINVNVQ